jgi:glycosyltransferase involved in cell wall biosynthesis
MDSRAIKSISRLVLDFNPDLIHAHSSKAGMIGRILSVRHRLPCIYTVHGWGWRGLGLIGRTLVFLLEKALAAVPRGSYIFVSHSAEREGQERLGLSAERGRVIFNGVDAFSVMPEPTGQLKIFMPARIAVAKDHETLIKAFEMLEFDSELILCGAGTESSVFQAKVLQWAPRRYDSIRCLGPRSDVPALLQSTHVFVLASNFEALPLSIIEAMSAGKAIIATDVGGVSELITDGENGLLVRKNDPQHLKACLSRLLDEKLRGQFRKAARDRYEKHFTLGEMARAVMMMYENLVEERKVGPK